MKRAARLHEQAKRNATTAANCILALYGHDPNTASPHARAGALLVAENLGTVTETVKGLVDAAAAFAKR